MHLPTRFRSRFLEVALLAAALAVGCAGAPVQEMSDARQALRAADKAGAEEHAPELMAEADRLLASARSNLYKGEYRVARDQAEQARDKAMEARRVAEQAKAAPPAN
jgi:hypothetical protein